jgi:hypothetical protein
MNTLTSVTSSYFDLLYDKNTYETSGSGCSNSEKSSIMENIFLDIH